MVMQFFSNTHNESMRPASGSSYTTFPKSEASFAFSQPTMTAEVSSIGKHHNSDHYQHKSVGRKTSNLSLGRTSSRQSYLSSHKHSAYVASLRAHQGPLTLKLTQHDIKKLRASWTQMLNDIYEESSDSSDEDLNKNFSNHYRLHKSNSKSHNQLDRSNYGASGVASSIFCRQLYMNLVAENPQLDSLFPTILHQASALSGVITIAISSLENIHILDDYLNSIGRRHSRILGIESTHFEMMAEALITTFEDRFGEHFTYELEDLWLRLYQYLANKLLENYTESYLLMEDGTVTPTMPVIDPLTGDIVNHSLPLHSTLSSVPTTPSSDILSMGNTSDMDSLYSSTDSLSVRQEDSHHSLETAFTKLSIHQDGPEVGNSVSKKNPLSKLYNFYKPKVIR